jgi:hypothetical protein
MSGGGGGGGAPAPTPAPVVGTEQYARAPTAQTFQPAQPGFNEMLAGQLSRGFGSGGATVPDFNAMLQMYKPNTVMSFKEPISTTAKAYDKTKHAPISTGNPALDRLLMGQK